MNGNVFDIKKVNAALGSLHREAQNADNAKLSRIAGDYLVIVSQEDFRKYAFRYNREKCKSIGLEHSEDLYQDTCLKVNDHIKDGKLPDIQKSASAYFLRSFSNTLLSAIKRQKTHGEVNSAEWQQGVDDEKSRQMISTGASTYDLENLKTCFYLLFFIQPKLKMKNFHFYCARMSFTSNELAARAIYNEKIPWEMLSSEEKSSWVYQLKNGHKTPNKTVSSLFSENVRLQGLIYKHKYFSENTMTALTPGSLIATGIMYYFYVHRESMTEGMVIPADKLHRFREKIDPDRLLPDSDNIHSYFDLKRLVMALSAVFTRFDNRGSHYGQWLNEELNSKDIINPELVSWLSSALTEVLKVDHHSHYRQQDFSEDITQKRI